MAQGLSEVPEEKEVTGEAEEDDGPPVLEKEMYVGNSADDSNIYQEIVIFGVLLAVLIIILIYAIVRHIKMYLKSFHFQTRNKFPQLPFWLKLGNLQRYREFEHPKFQIYQKHYAKKTWVNSTGQVKEKEKLVILMMRKVLTDVFGITVDARTLPDSTCVISIPMRNFKCSTARPEVFISKNDEVSMTRTFEYQMIGDYRIQVTYYKVRGIEYVAGVCIYIENPYQSIIHYRESIIKKLLNGIEYWSTVNVREESLAIKMMSDNQILMTRSVYGEIKYWKHLGDQKKFQQIEMVNAEMIRPEVQSETFSVKMCQFKKSIVMIERRKGEVVHAEWDPATKNLTFSKCESCSQPDDAPPPSYLTAQNSQKWL
ncbi:hypothetical protein L3Y34_015886 [Caenorhabditis briggsae]|uniref:Uncharacterized protein n=1 Tax=Caenorhabditis briggsae TaxID=6238 RepID=A0AAE9DYE0_CAEBR|nr:hypothetical protein L3Y34_015886 [Caenorhabditis briggsae]